MILPVLTYPHPVLSVCAAPVEGITEETRTLAKDILETMYSKEGLGLAAPQVGVSKRLIVVDISGPDRRENPMVLINPVIVSACGEVETSEGCLSVLNYRSKVQRSEKVRLEALNLAGEQVALDAEGMLAICLQHEIDHLNGVLFIDRISRLKRSLYEQKIKKWLKNNQSRPA